MPLLLFLLFPVLEIYVFFLVADAAGFWRTFFFACGTSFTGLLLLQTLGREFLTKMQRAGDRGKIPQTVLNRGAMMLGALLLLLPGFISDALGLLLILPGTRHLFLLLGGVYLFRKIQQQRVFVFRAGASGFGGGFGSGPRRGDQDMGGGFSQAGEERDVTPLVIDVKPQSKTSSQE